MPPYGYEKPNGSRKSRPAAADPTDPIYVPPQGFRPFAKPLLTHTSLAYQALASQHPGHMIALYTIVPPVSARLDELLHALQTPAISAGFFTPITLAPTHDFSWAKRGNDDATIADVLKFHMGLTTNTGNPWKTSATKFLVLVDPLWEANGLLLVDLDAGAHLTARRNVADGEPDKFTGLVGITRISVENAGRTPWHWHE